MPTPQELKAGTAMIMAVAETVRECREVPSGTIYAGLMGRVSLEGYQKIVGILTNAGLIAVDRSRLVRWTGPEVSR